MRNKSKQQIKSGISTQNKKFRQLTIFAALIMIKLLLVILTFGFVIQCTGSTGFLKKSLCKTEQCPEDNKPSNEKSEEEFKTDKLQSGFYQTSQFLNTPIIFTLPEFSHFYSSGFSSKPFLPPR